jgi:aspergillopepsin I
MLPLKSLIALAALWDAAVSSPLEQLASRKTFSLEQVAVTRQKPWSGPNSMRKTCLKYGLEVPDQLEAAVKHVEAAVRNVDSAPPGQTTIPVRPVKGDIEFLIAVQVGNHNLSMDLDTGSSDLYVFPPKSVLSGLLLP